MDGVKWWHVPFLLPVFAYVAVKNWFSRPPAPVTCFNCRGKGRLKDGRGQPYDCDVCNGTGKREG